MPGALAAGFGLGFLTAAQVGPIWLLCLRSTLRSGFRVGIAIGAGAAVIDLAYPALSAPFGCGWRRVGPRLVAAIDAASALSIVAFAGLLGNRTLSDA